MSAFQDCICSEFLKEIGELDSLTGLSIVIP
jgi:hypothetical protein